MVTHCTQSEEMQVRTASLIPRPFAQVLYQKLWGTVIYPQSYETKIWDGKPRYEALGRMTQY